MLSCWNESPRLRPSFSELKSIFESLLLADRKGDYIEFSFDSSKLLDDPDTSPELSNGVPGLLGISPAPRRHSYRPEKEECKLLLPNEKTSDDCHQKGVTSASNSPRFSPRRWSSRRKSSGHCSPLDRLSPSCQSPKKDKSSEGLPTSFRSPILLFPGQRSSGSLSPQNHSPFHCGSTPRGAPEERGDRERHRPMSLLVTRDRERDQRGKAEDRYVKEPSKLANLNQTVNHSLTGLTTAGMDMQQLQLRRGSEGMLNINSDGYVSFVGMDYGGRNDRQPSPARVQITVTEDL